MRKVGKIWLGYTGLLLLGCGSAGSPNAAPVVRKDVAAPNLVSTDLSMIMGTVSLKVGDPPEKVDQAFPQPANSAPFKELPAIFNGQYRARGYENSAGGFGAIYYENQLAAAVWRVENATAGELEDIVKQHISGFGEPSQKLPGTGIAYWFWYRESQSQSIMICAAPDRTQSQRFDITIGMGDKNVMDALRMNYIAAREDQSVAEKRRALARQPVSE